MSSTKLTPSKLLNPLETILAAAFPPLRAAGRHQTFSTNEAVAAYCTAVGISEDAWGYNETQGTSRPTYVRFQIIRTLRKSSKIKSAGRGYYRFVSDIDEVETEVEVEDTIVIENDSDMAEASTNLLNLLTNLSLIHI